jgi:putative oxidoreductase
MTRVIERPLPETRDERTLAAPEDLRHGTPQFINRSVLLVRVLVGALFIGHACQKLFGWFGGDGPQAWIGTIQKAGLQPAEVWAYGEALGEMGAGILLMAGFLTPLASAILIADMVVAIVKVHAPKGLWNQQGGFEYNLVLIALLLAIGLVGPGLYSLDNLFHLRLPRPATFIAALAVCLIAAGAAVLPLTL